MAPCPPPGDDPSMLRTLAFGLGLWVSVAGPTRDPAKCTPRDECCMVCEKGKACGNSCISRAKTCHKGRGCSCNASEVCPV